LFFFWIFLLGEQFLHDGDVCNLGSINLEKFVTSDRKVDEKELIRVTRLAVRMLDNVIDISDFPVDRVNNTARNNRRVGLGIMGFADMLYLMRIPYNSEKGRNVARFVMSTINKAAHQMSVELGKSKGVFKNWDKSIFKKDNILRRNSALTNIAPTGTIAMMFNVSGGVEPYFALAYHYKNVLGGDVQLEYFNKHLESALKENNCYSKDIIDKIHKRGTLQTIDEIPKSVRKVFVTSMDISPEDHVLMQSAMQEHCDNAISKTINFPNSATHDDIFRGYLLAWEKKCKGCTVYRNGSRFLQVLNLNDDDDKSDDKKDNKKQLSSSSSPPHSQSEASASKSKKNIIKINDKKKTSTKSTDIGDWKQHITEVTKYSYGTTTSDCEMLEKTNTCKNIVKQEGCEVCYVCGYSACTK
jgi:ribonucleoside-diphosphate reductase alpha chain